MGELRVMAKIERLTPLSEPKTGGLELMTLKRYNPLVKSVEGKVHEITPPLTLVAVPIVTGLPPNPPVASEICAENTLALGEFEKVPEMV